MDSIGDAAPVRTDEELQARWSSLLGHGDFAGPQLWLTWFDAEGRQLPVVMPIEDLPPFPDGSLDGLAEICIRVVEEQAPGGSVAMALCRPGSSGVEAGDRAWARALYQRSASGLPMRPLHLATGGSVRPVVLDDVA